MIVESIRLQHIKSYGQGPAGSGVTVSFQPGVNRIAGANGCGKTTIVEALGYALFSALPVFEENFKAETYLLAHGAKAGEIDVTFSVDGSSYRLERGVGQQSKRRSKVVDLADESICAEGDKEVAAFLCALLKLPSPERLTELFSKLVGVKQGRLVWPFDSKAGEAKRFFEPLLEVEVFRQCFAELKPVVEIFEDQRTEREKRNAVLTDRIRERSDAAGRLDAARQEVDRQGALLQKATEALGDAQTERARQEKLEREVASATGVRDRDAASLRVTAERREHAEGRVRESEEAVARAAASEGASRAYAAADVALRELEERRRVRDVLRRQREAASKEAATLAAKRDAARQHREQLLLQEREKRDACESEGHRLAVLHEQLASTKTAFEREQGAAESARALASAVDAWANALPGVTERMGKLASRIADVAAELGAWDPAELDRADEMRGSTASDLDAARAGVARTEERMATLRAQLEQLAGGVCPFLGEPCSQFEPAKARDEVARLETTLAEDRQREAVARAAHDEAGKAHARLVRQESRLGVKRERLDREVGDYATYVAELVPASISEALALLAAFQPAMPPAPAFRGSTDPALPAVGVADRQRFVEDFTGEVEAWWPGARGRIEADLGLAEAAKTGRTRRETEAQGLATAVTSLRHEADELAASGVAKDMEVQGFESEHEARRRDVAALDESLEPFGGLDEAIDAQRGVKEANTEGHEAWLQAAPVAADLENRRSRLDELTAAEAGLAEELTASEERLAAARAAFDPAALAAAKAACEARSGEVAEARTRLQHAQEERDRQGERFAGWQADVAESAAVSAEIARLDAAIRLTERARTTLRDSAPAVAQHLCTRIADRAQAVYNQINPDPVELEWNAAQYSLRITPGDRRFAMLSGGEQTKLALAMTLAMVEEFSRLRVCVFDEPTYGVDADSRRKLADAILQVQDAAGLDQLLLVSHDDAFEGRIEHTVLLTKSAAGGTAVEVQ